MDERHERQDSRGSVRRHRVLRWLLRAAAALALLVAAYLAFAPTGRYLARAAWEESKILWRRRQIVELVADTSVPAATRRKLQLVLEARTFASRELGLEVGNSFTTYSPLEHDTLVLVLSAAYRDRLESFRWWFPVVGWVPYKGYFDFAEAQRAERDFQRRGFDTYLRPASAFSTLGWFDDPLVSTTLRADTLSLANTVIHELAHNTYYARGQTEFNESFANFVGARGSADFFRARGQPGAVREAEARWSDEKLMAGFWKQLHDAISAAFNAHPGNGRDAVGARLALRDSIYRAARSQLLFRLGPQLRTIAPRYLERVRLDNAALLARRIYLTDLALFDSVWVREKRDTRRAVARIVRIAASEPGEPFAALRRWLAGGTRPVAAGESAAQ